jgi:predicted nucleotidyltransferase
MDFESALRPMIEKLNRDLIPYAVIGGFALHFWGYSRETHDLDFIIRAAQRDYIRNTMKEIGFTAFYESENVGHYEKGNSRVDFIFSSKPHGAQLLNRACDKDFLEMKLKVALPEDIIGLKVQSLANNPLRWLKEMADSENLMMENKGKLDVDLIGDYFALFKKEKDWELLLERYHASFG